MGETPSVVPRQLLHRCSFLRRRDARVRPLAAQLTHPFATLTRPEASTLRRPTRARASRLLTESRGSLRGGPAVHRRPPRDFVARSRVHAGGPCEPSHVPTIERCVRPTSAHPRIRKRAPIVSCGDRAPVRPRRLATPRRTRPVRTAFHDTVRASVARDRRRTGVVFPLGDASRSTSDAPVAGPSASRSDCCARASSSAEIDSRPHIVKRAGLLDPRRLPPTTGVRPVWGSCEPWLSRESREGRIVADATATTIRGRTHALS